MVRERLLHRARRDFERLFGNPQPFLAVAPGRVNLIGEHTDYNDGFVLPMAIDRHVVVAFAPRSDRVVRAYASAFGETREVSLDRLERGRGSWFSYVAGVAWAFQHAGQRLGGIDLAIVGDLPVGAGLSSSAALEIGVARALVEAASLEWDPIEAARLAQRAEQEFAGVACGIMDQLSVAASRDGCALLV